MKILLASRLLLSLSGVAVAAAVPFACSGSLAELSRSGRAGLERTLDHAREALSLRWVSQAQVQARPSLDLRD